jgi:hypothetical protein
MDDAQVERLLDVCAEIRAEVDLDGGSSTRRLKRLGLE